MIDTYIQIFAKAPIAGLCKTRLANDIGNERAAELQREMITDTLKKTYNPFSNVSVQLWCKPDSTHSFFHKMQSDYPLISLFNQQGNNLGEILDHGSYTGIGLNQDKLIQIGTDCPELDANYLAEAQEGLEEYDFVIGPASDGGYTMLAQKQYCPGLYNNINWGTATVLSQLINNIKMMGYSYFLLETLSDIDTIDDLKRMKCY